MNGSWEKDGRAILEPILVCFTPLTGEHEVSSKIGLCNFSPVHSPQNTVPNSEKKWMNSFWDKADSKHEGVGL